MPRSSHTQLNNKYQNRNKYQYLKLLHGKKYTKHYKGIATIRAMIIMDFKQNTLNMHQSQTPLSWTKLFFFAIEMFGIPTQSGNDHRTSKTVQQIKDNIRRHLLISSTEMPCPLWQLNHSPSYNRRPSAIDNKQRLRQLVNRHLSVNDVPAVVRAVASDDILCDITPDVLEGLQFKHPPAPSNIEIMPIPTDIYDNIL